MFEDDEEDHFLSLPFVKSDDSETLNRWYKKFQEYSGVDVEKIKENSLTSLMAKRPTPTTS